VSPVLVLVVAVLATTYAGPLVRLAAAPALAIAFWRLVMVLPVTGGMALREAGREQGAGRAPLPAPRSFSLMALSGALLAAHFWSWIASLRYTTVASSVVLVSLRPIFVWALAAVWLTEHPSRRERWGIALAVAGAVLVGAGDARLSLGYLGGDLLALVGAVTAAGYFTIGRRVRRTVGVWTYATVVYAVAAALLGLVAVGQGAPLGGFAGRDWGIFAALAAGPMLVGHTGLNYALKHFPATTVNVATLGEPVGATVIAWLLPAIAETPPWTALAGGAVVLVGIWVSLTGGGEPRAGSGS
jgi:drug/metabolite transporter (DMT)-like permease